MTPGLRKKAEKAAIGDVIEHRGKRYRMVECTGEAHSNAFIDNCSRCAPFWGRHLEEIDEKQAAIHEAVCKQLDKFIRRTK